jgi:hypothetical protein
MRRICKVSLFCSAVVFLLALPASAQDDSPSLGDAARHARQQKKLQGKDAAKTPKVITNEQLPEHVGPSATSHASGNASEPREVSYSGPSGDGKMPAEMLKSHIQSQKNLVSSLQSEIDRLNGTIHFTPANCVNNCAQWNKRQKAKQQEVEQMKGQLEDQTKRLEDMQESARQQGYGSSVYEP